MSGTERVPVKNRPTLNHAEATRKRWAEAQIGKNMNGLADLVDAFTVVHDQKLYRDEGRSFKRYVSERWNVSVSTAYRAIRLYRLRSALRRRHVFIKAIPGGKNNGK